MARAIVTPARDLIDSMRVDWRLNPRGQDIGETTGGVNRTVYNAFPRFEGSPQLNLHRDQVTRWRALLHEIDGRSAMLHMPMIDPLGFDWITSAGAAATSGLTFSTGAPFSTGSGFAHVPFGVAVSDVARGAREITVDVAATGVAIKPGQFLSHADLPFAVTSVLSVSGTEYTLRVRPGLRTAVTAGDHVLLEAWGYFELASDLSGTPVYGRNHRATPDVAFREVLTR